MILTRQISDNYDLFSMNEKVMSEHIYIYNYTYRKILIALCYFKTTSDKPDGNLYVLFI